MLGGRVFIVPDDDHETKHVPFAFLLDPLELVLRHSFGVGTTRIEALRPLDLAQTIGCRKGLVFAISGLDRHPRELYHQLGIW